MKLLRKAFSLTVMLALILTFPMIAFAMGFDTEQVYQSVFVIYAGNSLGSGFALGKDQILTNAHVVGDYRNVTVEAYGGKRYAGRVVVCDEYEDIALIEVSGASFVRLEPADLDKIRTGDDAYAIGAPKSLAFTLTKGIISSKSREVDGHRFIQTDAAINSGNSGGPLLNSDGEVIGVNSCKMSDAEGLGLAIPIDEVLSCLSGGSADTKGQEGGEPDAVEFVTGSDAPGTDAQSRRAPDHSTAVYWLVIGLTLSVTLNIVLAVLLVFSRGRNAGGKENGVPKKFANYDPAERTDFEIDLLD
jgi:Trypsin-like serine proteases, typically periplasmic, contain C-terminal PDZ domain